MDVEIKLRVDMPKEVAEAFGINEDTVFDSYYENGQIHICVVPPEELADTDDEYCEFICPHCKKCLFDE